MQSSSVEGASSFPSECIALVRNWQQAVEAKHYVNVLLRRNKRKSFGRNCSISSVHLNVLFFSLTIQGLLEHPYSSEIKNNNILLLQKKLYFAGKSGVGKTSTVDKLAGRGNPVTSSLLVEFKLTSPLPLCRHKEESWRNSRDSDSYIVLAFQGILMRNEMKVCHEFLVFHDKLEHTLPIIPHANGEPLLKRSSSYSHSFPVCNDSRVVWSANGDGSALTSKASSNSLNVTILTDLFVQVILSSIRTNNKILDLVDVESISGESKLV